MFYWFFLMIAIVTEVIGTLAMKYSADGSPQLGLAVMYGMLVISYSSLMIASKKIPLAVAFGAWESFGLAFICIFSCILFDEPLTTSKILGILAIIVGMLLLEIGIEHNVERPKLKEGH